MPAGAAQDHGKPRRQANSVGPIVELMPDDNRRPVRHDAPDFVHLAIGYGDAA
jgi:hypothetical protein